LFQEVMRQVPASGQDAAPSGSFNSGYRFFLCIS
jgi:hypothetical protein